MAAPLDTPSPPPSTSPPPLLTLLWPQLVPSELVRCYRRRMLNIHPGLLPSFGGKGYYGERVHTAVIASGARWAHACVRWGRIVQQCVVLWHLSTHAHYNQMLVLWSVLPRVQKLSA